MAYPWPGFGTFQFHRVDGEVPLPQSDTGWQRAPSVVAHRILGGFVDSIQTTSMGSKGRSFDMLLSPRRYDQLEALLTQTSLFTDWRRPTPDSRQAFLSGLTREPDAVQVPCWDGETRDRYVAHITLASQS